MPPAWLTDDVRQSMITKWQEFTKVHPHCATSAKGFRVEIESADFRVSHTDKSGRVSFACEWLTDPDGVVLYLGGKENVGIDRLDRTRAYEVLAEIAAALRFLGFRTETDGDLPQDKMA